jgi:cellobiose transport system permease protein
MSTTAVRPKSIKKFWRRKPKSRRMSLMGYIILATVTFASVFPFYWMFVVASNGSEEISKNPPTLIPGGNFFKVVADVYSVVPFNRALLNTLIVGTIVALAQVFFSALAGFAFAKLNFKGRRFMVLFVIGTMMLPSQLGIIPLFMLVSAVGWFDTLLALIVPALVTAFGVFWMRQIIDAQVPNELLEAASIDGAGVLRVYWSIVLPIIRQSAFVLGLFSFLATWNDFLWPGLVLASPDNYTAQIAVTQLQASYVLDYALNMGGAFMATAPLLLLFIFVGRRLVSGVMDGAVKG